MKLFKYELNPAGPTTIELPAGSRFLSAKEQYGSIVVYALVAEETVEKVHGENSVAIDVWNVLAYPTGDNTFRTDYFLGTVTLQSKMLGELVFHVFAYCDDRYRRPV